MNDGALSLAIGLVSLTVPLAAAVFFWRYRQQIYQANHQLAQACDGLTAQLLDAEKTLQTLQSENQQRSAAQREQAEMLLQFAQKAADLESIQGALSAELTSAQSRIVMLTRESQALEASKAELESASHQDHKTVAAREAQVRELSRAKDQMSYILQQEREAKDFLAEQIKDLARLKLCAEDELRLRQAHVDALAQEFQSQQQHCRTVEGKLQHSADLIEALQTQVMQLTQMGTQLEQKVQQSKAEAADLRQHLLNANRAKDILERDLQRVLERTVELELQSTAQSKVKPTQEATKPGRSTQSDSPGPMLPQFLSFAQSTQR